MARRVRSGSGRSPEPIRSSSRCCGPGSRATICGPSAGPAGLELTIAALADIHACRPWMPPERIRSIVEMTNALGADLIVLLGDYVAGHRFVTEYVPAERMGAGAGADCGRRSAFMPSSATTNGGRIARSSRPAQARRQRRRALEAVGIPVYENDACVSPSPAMHSGWRGSATSSRFCRRGALRPGRPHRRRSARRHLGEGDR